MDIHEFKEGVSDSTKVSLMGRINYSLAFVLLFNVLYLFLISPEDVQSIVSGKLALRYAGTQIDAMKSIAAASQHRSLLECQDVSNPFLNAPH